MAQKKWFAPRSTRWQVSLAWFLLILITLAYILEMSHQSILRYDIFKATAFDLGNMDQVVWNTLHGRPFEFTNKAIDFYGPSTRLAIHFEPIILPLSLVYLIWSDPRMLLITQSVALASGTLPVFLLTRKHLPEWPLLAPVVAGGYALMPALIGLNIFDFHPVALATPLLLYALMFLDFRQDLLFILFCVLACACKEDMPLSVGMLGFLVIWKYRRPRMGTAIVLCGFLWSAVAFGLIIPHFYPDQQANNYWYRYEALGSSPGEAIINVLIHPWLLITTFFTMERVYYFASLFRSGGFLCLLAPEWLIPALPSLAVNTLSTTGFLYSGVFHYNAAIIPFVVLASIHGLRRFRLIWIFWRKEELPTATQGLTLEDFRPARGPHPFFAFARRNFSRIDAWTGHRLAGIGIRIWKWVQRRIVLRCRHLLESAKRRVLWLINQVRHSRRLALFNRRMSALARQVPLQRLQWYLYGWITVMAVLNLIFMGRALSSFWADHDPGTHEEHVEQLLAMIPPDVPVSAGSNLNPHLSQRRQIGVFPYKDATTRYIIVDLNSVFPEDRGETASTYNQLVTTGQFRLLARAEGVVLLVRQTP